MLETESSTAGNLTSSLSPHRSVGRWQPGDRALNMQDVSPSIPLNSTVYPACEHCRGYHRDTHTKIYAHTHTHSPMKWYIFNNLHSHQEVLTSQNTNRWRLAGSGLSYVLAIRIRALACSSVSVCARACASPLTVHVSLLCRSLQHTHSECSQARCYFNTLFRKMNEGRFPPPPISHILIPCSLYPPPVPSLQSEKPDPVLLWHYGATYHPAKINPSEGGVWQNGVTACRRVN